MKRRNFLKSILGGIVVGPSALEAITQNVDKPAKNLDCNKIMEKLDNKPVVWLGLLYKDKEIDDKDYHRIEVLPTDWETTIIDGKFCIHNIKELIFPVAGSWDNVDGFGIYDTKENGHLLFSGKFVRRFMINFGDRLIFPEQYVKIEL